MNQTTRRQITMTMTGTREDVETQLAWLRQWSDVIPTLYFTDICSIGHIKDYLRSRTFKDENHEKSITALRERDQPHNGVSYLPALMEKSSDQRSKFSVETFVEEAVRDWSALREFFKNAAVYEPLEFVQGYATSTFGEHPERDTPRYLEFLQFANDDLQLYNVPGEVKRFKAATRLCAKADELGILKSHAVVLTAIACAYGCSAAQLVMKFAAKPGKFNPGNALGDIQLIQRVGKLAHMVHYESSRGGKYLRTTFVTADAPLHRLFSYFFVETINTTETDDGVTERFSVAVKEGEVFPVLFDAEGSLLDAASAKELQKLYDLIDA